MSASAVFVLDLKGKVRPELELTRFLGLAEPASSNKGA